MYIVYKTTNLVNGRFYIGVHKLNNTRKYFYLGSGILLKQAIKKYGRKNFKRETLKEFSSEQDAYDYEKELVNEEIISNPLCYNITNGGGNPPTFYGKDHPLFGVGHSEEAKQKMKDNHADFSGEKHHLFGKPGVKWNEERKLTHSKRMKGENNPMFGTSGRSGSLNPNSKKCCIKNKEFETIADAVEFFGVTRYIIKKWCISNRDGCYYI